MPYNPYMTTDGTGRAFWYGTEDSEGLNYNIPMHLYSRLRLGKPTEATGEREYTNREEAMRDLTQALNAPKIILVTVEDSKGNRATAETYDAAVEKLSDPKVKLQRHMEAGYQLKVLRVSPDFALSINVAGNAMTAIGPDLNTAFNNLLGVL